MAKKQIFIILLCFWIICLPFTVFAEGNMVSDMFGNEPNSTNAPAENNSNSNDSMTDSNTLSSNESLIWSLVKMAFILVLIIALIYFSLKYLNKRNKLFNRVKTLENLGGLGVGPNKSVQIIRVGSKFYLIGVGENVQLLEEITDENVIAEITNFQEKSTMSVDNFLPNRKRKSTHQNRSSDDDFRNLFSSELEKLKQTRQTLAYKRTEKEDYYE